MKALWTFHTSQPGTADFARVYEIAASLHSCNAQVTHSEGEQAHTARSSATLRQRQRSIRGIDMFVLFQVPDQQVLAEDKSLFRQTIERTFCLLLGLCLCTFRPLWYDK
jgi:hypothetical protein